MNHEFKVRISQEKVKEYAVISGDHNPIHQDPSFAREEGFDGAIVHGMFVLSLMGEYFNCSNLFHLREKVVLSAKFKKPVYVGEEIRFFVETKGKIVVKNSKDDICVETSWANN
jgi:acyl dehydratase